MSKIKEKVAKILLDINAVSLNAKKPFRFTSGILSPIYTDCRLLISFPKQRKIIKSLYLDAIKNEHLSFDVVAGTSTAGIPWASWIADALSLPMIYVRTAQKDHGKRNQIEGLIKSRQKAIVIEDLISTAGSSIETVKAIRSNGAYVINIFSIITYQMKKAEDNFKKNNIKLITLTDISTIVDVAEKYSHIDKKDQQIVLKWVNDPASWGKKMRFE